MVKKAIQKAMKNLKGTETGSTFSSLNKDDETFSVSRLREVEAITLAVFESLLSFISGPKSQPSKWSVVKMMQPNKLSCEEATETNEFAEVDAALNSLIGHTTSKPDLKSADNINVHNQLDTLESCIQDQEEGVECLFRQLIKTRVSRLNILKH
ncbi:unnamed protein product [Prunus armeniaca]